MAITTAILVSIGISVALSIGMRLLSSLLNPPQQQQSYGGQLQRAEPGTGLTVREAAAPQKIVFGTRRVAGTIVFAHTTQNNYLLHLVIAWAGHKVHGYGPLYFGDEEVPLSGGIGQGKFYGQVGCEDQLGTSDQGAFGNLIGHAPDLWTADHRGRGIACSYVTVHWNRTLFGSFDPSKIWRVVEGMEVLDPREGELVFSDNVALCVAAWMNSEKFGRGVPYAEINEDELVASANVDDEPVVKADGSTEKRYTCNIVLSADTPFVDNMNKLLSASHAECFHTGGQWVINSARWEEPTLTFGPDDFRAPFTLAGGIGREGFNAIKGKFASPAKNYQPDDFPAIIVPGYEIEDGGDGAGAGRVFQDVYLEATTSPSMAQRIARIDLRGQRQPFAFTAKLKLRGLKALTGKNVAIDFPPLGWEAKPFRVKRMSIVPGFGPEGQPGVIGVDLDLIETAEYIYDWTAADEIVADPAPNTTLPDPTNIVPASNLTAVESLYATRTGGGVKAKVTLAWDASIDAFVADGGWYVAEYRVSGASIWTKLPRVEDGATTIDILDIDPGIYDFRVWAFQYTGAKSSLAPTIMGRQIAGLSAPPASPANLSLVPNGNFAVLRWDFPPDLDVEIGGTIVFKHASQTSGAVWADGVTISRPLPAALTFAVLPLVAGTYMAKYRDAAGVWSETFAAFPTAQAGALTFDEIIGASLVEDPAFAGTKTDCVAFGGKLKLGGAGLFSSIPLVSAVPSLSYYGGVSTSGHYGWAQRIDLGTKTKCRITVNKTTLLLNVFDLLSERTGDVSTWARFGGDVAGSEADAHTRIRFTDSDPNGLSPPWSAFTRLDVGEFDARGFELETVLESFDPSFDIEVSGLNAIVEEIA